jgi:hypothetical protein
MAAEPMQLLKVDQDEWTDVDLMDGMEGNLPEYFFRLEWLSTAVVNV